MINSIPAPNSSSPPHRYEEPCDVVILQTRLLRHVLPRNAIHPFCPKSTSLFVTPAAESDGRHMSVTIHIRM